MEENKPSVEEIQSAVADQNTPTKDESPSQRLDSETLKPAADESAPQVGDEVSDDVYVAHVVDEDPEKHIGAETADPWDPKSKDTDWFKADDSQNDHNSAEYHNEDPRTGE